MRFIDYPSHLPRTPLSPETMRMYEQLKELAATLDIKIEVPKRGHSGEVVDCPITLHYAPIDGPLVLAVDKKRPAAPDTILDFSGARGPAFAELEAKAIERMTSMTKEPST